MLEAYRRDYPQSEYAGDVTRKLAVAYVEAGRGDAGGGGVRAHRRGAGRGSGGRARGDCAARPTCTRRPATGTRTVALLEQLVQRYPHAGGRRDRDARSAWPTWPPRPATPSASDYWQREIVKADAGAGAQRTDRTRFLAANAQLALAEPARDAFRAVRLAAPLKKSLAAKKQALETALDGYKASPPTTSPTTTTAATYEMAELYRTLARDLMASERPKKLSAEEREQYDALLEEQAFPFEEQAIADPRGQRQAHARRRLRRVGAQELSRRWRS